MFMIAFANKKGFVLITAYMVVAVLIILATSFSSRTIGEKRVADKERDTVQALWLAEAGLDRAIAEFPNSPLSGTIETGAYSTQTTQLTSTRSLINSTGGVPSTAVSPNNAIRKISAVTRHPHHEVSVALGLLLRLFEGLAVDDVELGVFSAIIKVCLDQRVYFFEVLIRLHRGGVKFHVQKGPKQRNLVDLPGGIDHRGGSVHIRSLAGRHRTIRQGLPRKSAAG